MRETDPTNLRFCPLGSRLFDGLERENLPMDRPGYGLVGILANFYDRFLHFLLVTGVNSQSPGNVNVGRFLY